MRAFILGNSGELLDHDLNLLKGEVVFGSNALPIHNSEIITNYVCADITMAFLPEVREMVKDNVIRHYSWLVWNAIDHENNVEPFETIDNSDGFNISRSSVYLGNTVSYAALQIAASLNYNPIYILGVDLGIPANGIHHIPEQEIMMNMLKSKNLRDVNKDKRIPITPFGQLAKKINLNYAYAKGVLDKEGIEVYNLSKGGNLNCFKRKVYKDVINHQAEIVSEVEINKGEL
jgi:hypothetical protein